MIPAVPEGANSAFRSTSAPNEGRIPQLADQGALTACRTPAASECGYETGNRGAASDCPVGVWTIAFVRLAAPRGANNVRVFGSVARGNYPGRTLFDLSGLLVDLEAVLHTSVDVVTERGLRARVRERVLSEAVPL